MEVKSMAGILDSEYDLYQVADGLPELIDFGLNGLMATVTFLSIAAPGSPQAGVMLRTTLTGDLALYPLATPAGCSVRLKLASITLIINKEVYY